MGKRLTTTIITFLALECLAMAQGLRFVGQNEAPIDKRTSMEVFQGTGPTFKDSLVISFDCRIYKSNTQGYIFRIEDKKEAQHFHLFYYYDQITDSLKISLNLEGSHSLVTIVDHYDNLGFNRWKKFRICFDSKRETISLSIDGNIYKSERITLNDTFTPVIYFGKNHKLIENHSFCIRNLRISDGKKDILIPLDEARGNLIHNSKGRIVGHASNHKWISYKSYEWEKSCEMNSNGMGSANYNPLTNEILFCTKDSIAMINLESHNAFSTRFPDSCPVDIFLGSSFIDTAQNRLFVYEACPQKKGAVTLSGLNLKDMSWQSFPSEPIKMQLHHHTSFVTYTPEVNHYLFGGFGNMHFNGTLFRNTPGKEGWIPIPLTGDMISPRYFTSTAYSPEENAVYVYGGLGNLSGDAFVGRKYLYDLYKVDLGSLSVKKLWETDWEGDDCVPVRQMILDKQGYFYTLCYPENKSVTEIQLYRFSIADGTHQAYGSKIPISSDHILTTANIYYNKDLNELLAVVVESPDDIRSALKVYTLTFPPSTRHDVIKYCLKQNMRMIISLSLVCFILLSVMCYLIYRLRRRRAIMRLLMEDSDNEEILSLGKKVFPYKGLPNTIRLFGQFTAIDRNGRDISYLFTENLTKLFCLLVEYHKKDGISSKLLGHMMWPDKDEKKIKNSKGVAVMQLRGALALMNGIDIVFDSGNYVLKVTPELHCDYLDALGLSEDRDLTGIASQGPFLSFMTDPLFDDFKSETEEFLAEALLGEMEHRSSEKDWREVIRTSNSLFMQDPLNETGFSLLMTALVELGLIKEATIRYQRFTEEYMKTMGTKFAVPLKKYLQQKNRDSKR